MYLTLTLTGKAECQKSSGKWCIRWPTNRRLVTSLWSWRFPETRTRLCPRKSSAWSWAGRCRRRRLPPRSRRWPRRTRPLVLRYCLQFFVFAYEQFFIMVGFKKMQFGLEKMSILLENMTILDENTWVILECVSILLYNKPVSKNVSNSRHESCRFYVLKKCRFCVSKCGF